MNHADENIVQVALSEVQRMRGATLGHCPETQVQLPSEDFRRLADLIERLCHQVADPESLSLNHCRYFVPLDVFRNARERALSLEHECAKLRGSLPYWFRGATSGPVNTSYGLRDALPRRANG